MARPDAPPGSGWAQNVRNFTDLFLRWGGAGDNIRGLLNLAIPTVVIDRFRDDDEGSIFGLQAVTNGVNNQFSAVAFGSAVNDWELHEITVSQTIIPTPGSILDKGWHMFTPIDPYNPVVNLTPAGIFLPGLLLNRAFTFGTVQGLGGANPVAATPQGPLGFLQGVTSFSTHNMLPLDDHYTFDPPLRILRDGTFAVQSPVAYSGARQELRVSIWYNERPKR